MKTFNAYICTGNKFSAHTDFEDLERLGWDFSSLYEGVAIAKDVSIGAAEVWEKDKYHVRLFNNGNGLRWIPSHNEHGDIGDSEDPGDQKLAHQQIQELYNTAKLWEVFHGEENEDQ